MRKVESLISWQGLMVNEECGCIGGTFFEGPVVEQRAFEGDSSWLLEQLLVVQVWLTWLTLLFWPVDFTLMCVCSQILLRWQVWLVATCSWTPEEDFYKNFYQREQKVDVDLSNGVPCKQVWVQFCAGKNFISIGKRVPSLPLSVEMLDLSWQGSLRTCKHCPEGS